MGASDKIPPCFLFTDYGLRGPYIGQVQAVLFRLAPRLKVINLLADAPRNNPRAAAYLLASLVPALPEDSILFCVVDPGVGTGKDRPVVLNLDGRRLVGPNNGLFDIVAAQADKIAAFEITWRPARLSNSFHGRDLYAPVCARLANNAVVPQRPFDWQAARDWPPDLYEVIYIDHFGNCMSGIRAGQLSAAAMLRVGAARIRQARTFAKVPKGQAFWYANANRLIEIAVNQGNAARQLRLNISDPIGIDGERSPCAMMSNGERIKG